MGKVKVSIALDEDVLKWTDEVAKGLGMSRSEFINMVLGGGRDAKELVDKVIDKWFDRLDELVEKYHVLVTLHPWISKKYRQKIVHTEKIIYIRNEDILPYFAIADILISDTSSIIGEFCALNKPIITFKVDIQKRLTENIRKMISEISEQVNSFDELKHKLPEIIKQPDKLSNERVKWNKILYYNKY